jgi:hypothetical protein
LFLGRNFWVNASTIQGQKLNTSGQKILGRNLTLLGRNLTILATNYTEQYRFWAVPGAVSLLGSTLLGSFFWAVFWTVHKTETTQKLVKFQYRKTDTEQFFGQFLIGSFWLGSGQYTTQKNGYKTVSGQYTQQLVKFQVT